MVPTQGGLVMKAADISLDNVSLKIGKTQVFSRLSLAFQSDGLSLLIGANGSGKTQILRLIHGLSQPQSGQIIAPPVAAQALLFQSPLLLNRSVIENLRYLFRSPVIDKTYFNQQLEPLLVHFELKALLSRNVNQLSGGQRKRVATVRLLLQNASCYLFDEPAANVDYHTNLLLESSIVALLERGKKVIVTTHDLPQMERLFLNDRDEVIVLSAGQLVQQSQHLDFEQLKRFL